jgi:hypothetical protein
LGRSGWGSDSPINNHKSSNILGRIQVLVAPGHDEPNDTLETNSDGECFARTQPVTGECTGDRSGDVEQIDDRVPAKALPQRIAVAEQDGDPGRGVDAKGVGGEVVDEPDEGDDGLEVIR